MCNINSSGVPKLTSTISQYRCICKHRPQCKRENKTLQSDPAWGLQPSPGAVMDFSASTKPHSLTHTYTHTTNNTHQTTNSLLVGMLNAIKLTHRTQFLTQSYKLHDIYHTNTRKYQNFSTTSLLHQLPMPILRPMQTAEKRELTRWPTARRRCLRL